MKTIFLLILIIVCAAVAQGQGPDVFHERLGKPDTIEMKDGKVSKETFSFPPSFRVSINYSAAQMAESLRILPDKSQLINVRTDPTVPQEELQSALDKIVPLRDRGEYVMGTFLNIICLPANDCAGVQWAYEKLSIYYNSGNAGMRYAEVSWKETKKK